MKKIVIPTGYMGSGSSAVTALVSELDAFCGKTQSQEFVFLHCPCGVFDLEDRLLFGNNTLISDEYLFMFYNRMKELYDLKFWWPGYYKNYIGSNFMNLVDNYLSSLTDYQFNQFWYMSEKPINFKMKLQKLFQAIKIKIFRRKNYKAILNRQGIRLSYPSPEKFYQCSKKFIQNILNEITEEENVILDQLLLPFNLYRMEHYFEPGEAKVIVVERDPRDVFLQNKYFYSQNHEEIPFPTDAKQFCEFYRKMRNLEKIVESPDILRIHFEDLVYQYDKTLNKIYRFLGITKDQHTKKGSFFQPEKSINNTQIFNAKKEYLEEVKIMEEELKEYLYSFPEKRISKIEDVFID